MLAVAGAAMALFAVVLWAVASSWPPLSGFDRAAAQAAARWGSTLPWWAGTWGMVSWVFGPWVFRAVAAAWVIVIFCLPSSPVGRGPALALAIMVLSGGLVPVGVKALVDRARPPEALVTAAQSSFPSAHAFAVVVAVGAALVFMRSRESREKGVFWVVGAVIVMLVCAARVLLAVHYVSDVIAGAALGIAWVALVCAAVSPARADGLSGSDADPAR